jgi:CRISPR-associated protein Cas1
LLQMAASHTLPHSYAIRKSGVLVLNGYGIRVQVNAGHLLLHDGIADERRTIRLPRVNHGLKRLIMIGSDGFVTLEALRWLADQDAAFVMLDRRGKVLAVTGPVAPSDAKLRRAQALALGNGTALKISKELISQKLAGQELLVRDMLHDSATADVIARFSEELLGAKTLDAVRLVESQGARWYWKSWGNLPIRWPRKDEHRVPEHWKRFGSRISPLTHSPRLASCPPNALLNLLYALLESESRLSAAAMGLDPGLGCLHMDTANRDSLACDIMEPIRPKCDAFVLNWLQSEPLRRSDFWEDRNGNCRIGSALAIKLCATSDTWRRLVAPVAEHVAQEIWSSVFKPTSTSKLARQLIATRLTQSRKRSVKGSDVPSVRAPKPASVCRGCGATTRSGRHCPECGREVSREKLIELAKIGRIAAQSPESRKKHSDTQRRHEAAKRAWRSTPKPDWPDENTYVRQIQPRLAAVTISALASTLGVSEHYAADIRAGRHRPHPRHWQALARLVGVSGSSISLSG